MRKGSILAVVLVAFTLTAVAAEKVKKHSFKLFSTTDVNGVELKAGDYQVAFADNSATFYRNGKEIAKAVARTEEAAAKFERNSVLYLGDERTLSEIRFEGSKQKVVLEGVSAKAGGSKATSGTKD
jgi:hypothetical protein